MLTVQNLATSRLRFSDAFLFGILASLTLEPLLGSTAALGFLLFSAAFLGSSPIQSANGVIRYWFILLIPIYCLSTVLWSQYPDLTLRYATQLIISFVVAIAIGSQSHISTILKFIFISGLLLLLANIAFGQQRSDIGAWLGVFASKNAFAATTTFFALVSLWAMSDRTNIKFIRLLGVLAFVSTVPMLIYAQSAGATISLVLALAVWFSLAFMKTLASDTKIIFLIALIIILYITVILYAEFGDTITEQVLGDLGKDSTLTGRTDLWRYGLTYINERPFLGIGYQAFWVQGNPDAEIIWREFGIGSRGGFHFHSMYISNTVEIGIVGLALEIALLHGAFLWTLARTIKYPRPEMFFLSSFLMLIIIRSVVEVDVFYQFGIVSMVPVFAVIHLSRGAPSNPSNA